MGARIIRLLLMDRIFILELVGVMNHGRLINSNYDYLDRKDIKRKIGLIKVK